MSPISLDASTTSATHSGTQDKPWPIPVSKLLQRTVWLTLAFVLAFTAYKTAFRPDGNIDIDFDIFYRVAKITQHGELAKVYDLAQTEDLASRYPTNAKMLPYAYPPTTSLINQGLADLPPWLGYVVYQALGLALFALALPRLARDHRAAIGVAAASAMILNVSTGQNGLITAGLAGLAMLALRRNATSGLVAASACLAIKPHLALGPPLALLIARRWTALALLGLAGLAFSAIGIVYYGPDMLSAWLDSLRQSNAMLALGEQGMFPIKRMLSIYAFLRFYGASHAVAMTAHVIAAGIALVTAVVLGLRTTKARAFAISLVASLFISPYLYDYDAAILVIALAAFVADGAFDRARTAYVAALTMVGVMPIPGALSDWKLTGGIDIGIGAIFLVGFYIVLCRVAAEKSVTIEQDFEAGSRPAIA